MALFRGYASRKSGFVSFELVVLLVVMLAFLAGIVLLMDDVVSSGKGAEGRRAIASEGERVLGVVERMVRDAEAVGWGDEWGPGAPGAKPGYTLELLVNIDGDSRTGSYSVDGVSGLERVFLCRPSATSTRLVALLYSRRSAGEGADAGSAPKESVITDLLDRRDPRAFRVDLLAGSEGAKDLLRVSVKLNDGTESQTFLRLIEYKQQARCGDPYCIRPAARGSAEMTLIRQTRQTPSVSTTTLPAASRTISSRRAPPHPSI